MILWRDYRHLLLALLASLLLHLLFGFGLNVYGDGPTAAKLPTRLTLRLVRPQLPASAPPIAVATPLLPQPSPRVLTAPQSRFGLPAAPVVDPVLPSPPAPATAADTPPVLPPEPPAALPEAPLPQMPTLGVIELPELRFLPADELDVVAKPATPIAPNFPIQLQRSDVNGMVIILLKIDETGVAVDAEIEFADPPGVFDQAALGPFIYARYTPAQKNGLPVRSEKRIEVIFGDYQRPLLGPPLPPKSP